MVPRIVRCERCGRQFNANMEGIFNRQTGRYLCGGCAAIVSRQINEQRKEMNRMRRKIAGDINERQTGMRQSIGAMIAKIAAGVLFMLTPFVQESQVSEAGTTMVGIVVGLAIIAWGVAPYLIARKNKIDASNRQAQEEKRRAAEYRSKTSICPHCGGVTHGTICEYCGSPIIIRK